MGDVYPELRQRSKHIIDTTRAEEQRFLDTIEGGMKRFDELAPEKYDAGVDGYPRHDLAAKTRSSFTTRSDSRSISPS